jgi:hypothetical protein
MNNKDLIECCKAVLDFINEENDGRIPTLKQNIMNDVLIKNDWKYKNFGDMVGFTKHLNEKIQLGYSIADEEGNLRPFFEKHSRHFYKSLIRDLTINEIIEDEMG